MLRSHGGGSEGLGSARASQTSAWDRLGTLGARLTDIGLLLAVGSWVCLDLVALNGAESPWPAARGALSLTAVALVALRRRWPVPMAVLACAAVLTATMSYASRSGTVDYPSFAPMVALVITITPLVRRQPWEVAAVAAAASAACIATLAQRVGGGAGWVMVILAGGAHALGVTLGVYLRALDRRQLEAAIEARIDERRDLAREIHDLVAHHVAGIVVQAQAARIVGPQDPAPAAAALEQIEAAGKDALTAMRQLVGALRADHGGEAAPTTAPVGLQGLDDLITGSATLGLPVDLSVEPGAAATVPGSVAVSAHRIVQEALTNVRRHAQGASRALVDLRLDSGALVVEVVDDGHLPVAGSGTVDGFGLIGMRERAAALGGSLRAGPLEPPAHGWRVRAELPLEAPSARVPA